MGVNRISISDLSQSLLLCYPVGDAFMPMSIYFEYFGVFCCN